MNTSIALTILSRPMGVWDLNRTSLRSENRDEVKARRGNIALRYVSEVATQTSSLFSLPFGLCHLLVFCVFRMKRCARHRFIPQSLNTSNIRELNWFCSSPTPLEQ